MTSRPILFSAPMVRGLLEGRKHVTRRLIQSPAKNMQKQGADVIAHRPPGDTWYQDCVWSMRDREGVWQDYTEEQFLARCPYGKPMDVLWVKETFAMSWVGGNNGLRYRADLDDPFVLKWTPSIYMKREHSRLTLPLISVRAERLQDITEVDAKEEGVVPLTGIAPDQSIAGEDRGRTQGTHPHTLAFAALWDELNGDRAPWRLNPFVWRLGFEVCP